MIHYFQFRNQKIRWSWENTYTGNNIVLNRAEFNYDPIDSTNLESWRKKTLSEFKKRAESANCSDLRTENEKEVSEINLEDFDDEEVKNLTV